MSEQDAAMKMATENGDGTSAGSLRTADRAVGNSLDGESNEVPSPVGEPAADEITGGAVEHEEPVGAKDALAELEEPMVAAARAGRELDAGKYRISGGRLVNIHTGQPIPLEEPVFILRGQDALVIRTLDYYRGLCSQPAQKDAVRGRIERFIQYRGQFPERMGEPD